ncbi:MAG TPA: Bax inhibitor-1/YccA family protein [Terriglobia bacterium]|nr:Bax inhibitor-1/YccA family protein [Terriglobia bacterium]
MVTRPNSQYAVRSQTGAAELDVGLRSYMLKVYNYMAAGLALTGLTAYGVFASAETHPAIIETVMNLRWIIMLATIGMVFWLSFGIRRMSAGTAQMSFWAYAILNGLWLMPIFLIYTQTSIARAFFVAAATFAGMSLYGYTTKRDLTGMGSFLFMGLIGLIVASLVNIFLASSALTFAISAIGVLVFTGLTAYDSQKIKEMYFAGDSGEIMGKKAVMGALQLYLDFINLFIMLLQFFGNRR